MIASAKTPLLNMATFLSRESELQHIFLGYKIKPVAVSKAKNTFKSLN